MWRPCDLCCEPKYQLHQRLHIFVLILRLQVGFVGEWKGLRLIALPLHHLAKCSLLHLCTCSKGKAAEELRGAPYLLSLEEVATRTAEAWDRGATEVCMQVKCACSYKLQPWGWIWLRSGQTGVI